MIEVGAEDGTTMVRAGRTEPVISTRLYEGEEDYGAAADQLELAAAVVDRVGEQVVKDAFQSVHQLVRMLRSGGQA